MGKKKEVTEQQSRLDALLDQMDKDHRASVISGDGTGVERLPSIPTGIPALDVGLKGGIAVGTITELYGPEGAGKSTLAMHAAAGVTKRGGIVLYVDVEHALDFDYAKEIGIDLRYLMLAQPSCGEEALNIVEENAKRMTKADLIIVDSVALLTPKLTLEGKIEDVDRPAVRAKMMEKATSRLVPMIGPLRGSGVPIIFINQIRERIGVVYGNPEKTPGGSALKFAAALRLDVRRAQAIQQGTQRVGHHTKIKVIKCKYAPPFVIEADLYYGKGFDFMSSAVQALLASGRVEQRGAIYEIEGEKYKGKEKLADALKSGKIKL